MSAVSSDSKSAPGSPPGPVIAAPERPKLAAALDIAEYASGTAGEAWALLARLLFLHGKPRFPAIARELDLHPGQAIVVRLLAEPCPMGELAEAMHCDNSNITGIVDRLEERGLVERQPAEYDRRVKLIALTPDGVRLREELNVRMAEPPEPLTALSEKDQKALRDILRRAVEEPDRRP
ncbi:MAG: MarR family winged helix-turn-helix transcriptional regulator [Solirubrobacterales bacterium]